MQPTSQDWPQEYSTSQTVPESYLGGCLQGCAGATLTLTVRLVIFPFPGPASGGLTYKCRCTLTAHPIIPENNAIPQHTYWNACKAVGVLGRKSVLNIA